LEGPGEDQKGFNQGSKSSMKKARNVMPWERKVDQRMEEAKS
jgi:hypothetical protein